ncbi:uncharacterized protein [Argopecten irradians]|uniref:uncharacterized protein n=1 Tax=Argopecten irradians TaxID=31199 RepID=UPI003712CB52
MGRRQHESMTSNTDIDDRAAKRTNPSQYPDCSLCCQNHFCNTNLCDPHPMNLTRKRCLSCDSVEQLSDCHTVQGCDADENCYASYYLNTFGEKRFRLGCMRQNVCDQGGSTHVGETQYCSKCCSGDHCNRGLCKHAADTTPVTMTTTPTPTTPTTAAPVTPACEDDPTRPCISSLLSSICGDPQFSQLCKKSCGLCGGTSGAPNFTQPAAVTVVTTPTSTLTQFVTSTSSSIPGCEDSKTQSCAPEILPIVCFDDVMKYYCKKSCNICGLTNPPPVVCADTHPNECSNQTLLQGICSDIELATLFCAKSCGTCHAEITTASTCRDDDTRCFNIPFLTAACVDPNQRNLCKKSCKICT